jgi:hypothetical protein
MMTPSICAAVADRWDFRGDMLAALVKEVPKILRSQDRQTGHFGSGVWIVQDQNVIYPLAAAWAIENPANPYFHSHEVLEAIMSGGDALIAAQDARGMWVFRKKDNSTWGDIHMPWTYSRWARAFGLIKDAMPPQRRARWETALALGYEHIASDDLKHDVQNIPAHHAMGLYAAGKAMNRPEWCDAATQYMKRVVEAQDPGGFWTEHAGPVVNYNFVYVDALGTYYALSRDATVLPALRRAAAFHAAMTYPDGTSVETVDERNPYDRTVVMPNVGFTFSAEGRAYARGQFKRKKSIPADTAASYLLFGDEGEVASKPANDAVVLGNNDAMTQRRGPWFACLSAYTAPLTRSRWIQDRQNFVSLFHDRTGLIVGGGNTKLQPLWSTFSVGDVNLLSHRPSDENPNFIPPDGLVHVPKSAKLDPPRAALELDYAGRATCGVRVEWVDDHTLKLVYSIERASDGTMAAHVTLMPHVREAWSTSTKQTGKIGPEALDLSSADCGGWFAHHGWRVSVPPGARIIWPALPHNPYVKDGHAEPREGRIVLMLPFDRGTKEQTVTIEVP